MRLIIGISGASGVIIGYRLLQALKQYPHIETHLVISQGAVEIFAWETDLILADIIKLADHYHDNNNMAACISSGSFVTAGMIVVPCSMKTLAGISHGFADNLLIRAADVCLKEGRKVVLMPREMPFSRVHLQNMLLAATNGCRIIPPLLTFYHHLEQTEDQVHHIIGKVLLQFDLAYDKFIPWQGA